MLLARRRRATRAWRLHVSQERCPERPRFSHPEFDFETPHRRRLTCGDLVVASVYVPNGGKDFRPRCASSRRWTACAADVEPTGRTPRHLRRPERRAHRYRRAPQGAQAEHHRPAAGGARAARADHRRGGLVDVGRALAPDDEGLFTWWAPWRNMRQRNIGWRLDYILASHVALADASALRRAPRDRHERSRAGDHDTRRLTVRLADRGVGSCGVDGSRNSINSRSV